MCSVCSVGQRLVRLLLSAGSAKPCNFSRATRVLLPLRSDRFAGPAGAARGQFPSSHMKEDLRFAVRMMATHRWFSLAVIATLALGIGVNTTVFTLANAVLFKPVPVPGGDRLVSISGQNLTRADSRFGVSLSDFNEFRATNRTFAGIEACQGTSVIVSENGNPPERFRMARVTPGLFTLIKTPVILGRGLVPDDARPGGPEVLLLSHAVWQSRYGGDPGIVGRVVRVDGKPATVVGVMPEGFRFPYNEDGWLPLASTADLEKRSNRWLQVFALLKPGTPIAAAGADLAVIAQRLAKEFPDTNKDVGVLVRTFHEAYNGGPIRLVFLTMLGAVGFVLLIACANVAVMMLSRAVARRREIAVRAALGASRWQLIRQLLIESVLLSVLGGLTGLGLAAAGVHVFDLTTQDAGKPYWIEFSMDYVVFGYLALISVLTGLLFGLAPALRASRVDLNMALKDGAPASGSSNAGKLVGGLVVLQFALTVVLLAGAGLMVRSFFAAQVVNRFVPARQIFTARVGVPEGPERRYAQPANRLRLYEQLLERTAALPGVTHAALTTHLPGLGSGIREIEIEGRPLNDPKGGLRVATGVHTPGYLAMIALPVIAGRDFTPTDGDAGKEAAIVTREFAAKYWANQSAVGARFRFLEGRERKPGTWISVVGVCGDIVQRGQDPDAPPLVFTPLRQEPMGGMALALRTSADPAALAGPVRAAVQSVEPDLPLFEVRTLPGALERQLWPLRVFGTLFLSFAGIALLIASVGLYAVMAEATGRRTREIGIRMALGATSVRILQLVLGRGLVQLSAGVVLGLGGAYFATQLLARVGRLLFQVSAHDPAVFASVTITLIGIGVMACLLPARKAARIDPVNALRLD